MSMQFFRKFADKPSELLYNNPSRVLTSKDGRLESHFCSKGVPEGINVGLAVIDENAIQLRVWERGAVGLKLAQVVL